MRLVSLIGLLLLSFTARAANVVTSDVTNQAKDKKWHILLDANLQPAQRDDQRSYTDYTVFFDYQLDKANTFRILQAPRQQYEVVYGEEEWLASDTIVSHYWNTGKSVGPARLRWVTSVNIPTAQDSMTQDKITTVAGTLQANALFAGKFMVSARPFLRYNWYEFKTSKSGTPLPAWVYGLNVVASYQMTSKFSLNGTFGYNIVVNNASQYDESTGGFNTTPAQTDGRYTVYFAANYEWTDKFATYLSFLQGDSYIRDGRYEVYAYDPVVSRLGAGATFYF